MPNIPAAVGGWLWLGAIIIPIYYIAITSLKPREDYYSTNPLLPSSPTFAPYATVLQNQFVQYFLNSVVVVVCTVAGIVFLSLLASYVIVRSRSGLAVFSNRLFLLGIAIPIQATIIPIYLIIVQLGLYDTLAALILPGIASGIPITVLILTNFMRDIPNELYESMTLDGAGDWKVFRTLVLPLSLPAITTVGVYNALNSWNNFLFPLILTQSSEKRTLPLSLWTYQGEFQADIPAVLAAVVLSALPILVLYVFGRRHLVAGLTAGFGK
ncbi:carbohydrate ABC transporter permease [Kocuria rosea]|uniref:Carbohydrate ABC transporter permease n=1 Tax=Kocuria rosea TaxID=1275 RepID=A0A4R5YNE7_KOCRO|nr:carbohydrate ABC transporter permease [Kocuria rosea]